MLELQTLGGLRLHGLEGELLHGRRKELALLAYLARHASRAVPRGELATLLWGDRREAQARQSLRQALAHLRPVVDGMEVEPDTVRLREDALAFDLARFEAALDAGRAADAITSYGGRFLEGSEDAGGEAYQRWVNEERRRLDVRLTHAFAGLVSDAGGRGDWTGAAAWAERWAGAMPLDETAHARLVEALRLAGHRDEALAVHAAFTARLADQLQVAPSDRFLELRNRLTRAPPAPPPRGRPGPGSMALFTPDLIGRGDHLAALHAAWRSVQEGVVTTVFVEGEEGIGKTRLCEAFLDGVAPVGACVMRARATETGRKVPWSTARELFAGLKVAPGIVGAPPEALAALARVVPGVGQVTPPPSRALGVEWPIEEAVAEAVSAVGAEVPVILFVDDLPSADPDSVHLLAALVRRLRGERVLLLVTARPAEAERVPVLAELRSTVTTQCLHLGPLALTDLEALLDSMIAMEPEERHRLAVRLAAETGGNPLYAVETVAALLDDGYLTLDARGVARLPQPQGGSPFPIPPSIREAVRRRLDRLSEPARLLAAAAAVLGTPGERALFAEIAALTPAEFDAAVDELLGRRLLRHAAPGAGHFEFVHQIIRRVMYDAVPAAEGRALHRRAAAALSQRGGGDQAAQVALRYHRARARAAPRQWLAAMPHRAAVGAATLLAVAAGVLLLRAGRTEVGAPPLLAVGVVRDFSTGPQGAAVPLPHMLATNLARVPGLQVLSRARLYELLGPGRDTSAALAEAARRGGAGALLEGALYGGNAGVLRLDLLVVELSSGKVLHALSVTGRDAFSLADSATALVAAGLGLPAPGLRVADVTTTSLLAYRLYEEGLKALYAGQPGAAAQLLRSALAEDPTFVMAAYFASGVTPGPAGFDLLQHAAALADHAGERERLLISGRWAIIRNDPRLLAIAESLATRHPVEPDGHLLLGRALCLSGRHLDALAPLRRVVAMDSATSRGPSPRCLTCEAFENLFTAYYSADSLAAAEREMRQWTRLRPGYPRAWELLSMVLRMEGRDDEALEASRTLDSINPGAAPSNTWAIEVLLQRGAFGIVDSLLGARIRWGTPVAQYGARWWLVVSLRYQGRLREALAVARALRALDPAGSATPVPYAALMEAQVLFDMGRYRESAALFEAVAREGAAQQPAATHRDFVANAAWPLRTRADTARMIALADTMMQSDLTHHRTWYFGHAARALIAAGDRAGAARLMETVAVEGARSAMSRDRNLHYHVAGLLLLNGHQPDEAANAFRSAQITPYDFTRNNLELGHALLRAGRPREAVPVLRAGVRGDIGAAGLYATKTELHELLGQAFEEAGQPDSAVVHYHWVLDAWRSADIRFAPRVERIRERLAALGMGRPTG